MESLHSEIPDSISPKAAERLGIAPPDRRSWGSQRSQGSQSSEKMSSNCSSGSGTNNGPETIDMDVPDHLCANSSPSMAQSPGLILWPSTFIPMEPLELEMHACKHMHVLLGCKAALSDFIQDVKGTDGRAHISQVELNDLTWEYECFRRKRFNWPAELPSLITSHPTVPQSAPAHSDAISERPWITLGPESTARPPRSGSIRPRHSPGRQTNPSTPNSPSMPPYNREDLTFVRAMRIYEAYKIE